MLKDVRETPGWAAALNPFAWVQRAFGGFSPAAAPPMSRANYRRELTAAAFLPWVVAAMEGGVIGVIVDRYYQGVVRDGLLALAVAVLAAAPSFANIASFLFVRLSHGRHKVRSLTLLQVAIGLLAILVALAPRSPAGLVLVALAVIAARMCMAGVVTIRSTVWRANYRRDSRARLTGKIAIVQQAVLAAIGYAVALAMEWHEEAFRFFLPLNAAVSLVGVAVWTRVRVRGHRRLLSAEREQQEDRRAPSFNPLALARVLAADHRYAQYMALHFLIGFANMMIIPPVIMLTRDRFAMNYGNASLITHTIPYAVMPLTISAWSALLDRRHVVTYRATHTWVFVAAMTLFFVAGWWRLAPLLFIAAAVKGTAYAGGALAWNLGHNDFANDANAAQYMSVHVTLTGIRGLLAPFVGTLAYEALEAAEPGRGSFLFAASAAMLALGSLGFAAMARRHGLLEPSR